MGFWKGAKDGFIGAAESTWDGVKGAGKYVYDFATDGKVREAAWDTTVRAATNIKDYAASSYEDPSKPFRDLRDGAAGIYTAASGFVQNADAEDWGNLIGGGAFTVVTLPVGGVAAKGIARGSVALKSIAGKGTGALKVRKATKAADRLDNKKPDCKERCKVSDQKRRGAERSRKYRHSWPKGDLEKSIERFVGKNPTITITQKGKKIYENPEKTTRIVEDISGRYYRIEDTSISGRRRYLDLDGNIPNNKTLENGKQMGRSQSEYNAVTHFKIGD